MRTNALKAYEMGERLDKAIAETDLIDRLSLHATQIEALTAIAAALREGNNNISIEIPGSVGKTRTAIALVEALSTEEGPAGTIYKAPTHTALQRFWTEAGKVKSRLLDGDIIGEYHTKAKDPDKPILLTTNRSHTLAYRRNIISPENIELIISDEGHHQLADGQRRINQIFSDAVHITMTATSTYSAEKTLKNSFYPAFAQNADEAVDAGHAAPYENYILLTEGIKLNKARKSGGDFNQKDLEAATDHASRYIQIARMIETWVHPKSGKPLLGQKIVAYCGTIQQAENAAAFFNRYFNRKLSERAGFENLTSFAFASHSANMNEENEAFDQDFRDGKHLLMVAVRQSAESYSNDAVSAIINITPSSSSLLAAQRGYRAMRLSEEDPDKVALIFDVLDQDHKKRAVTFTEAVKGVTYFKSPSEDGFNLLEGAFENYWEIQSFPDADPLKSRPRVITPDDMIAQFANRKSSKKELNFLQDSFDCPEKIIKGTRSIKGDRLPRIVRNAMNDKGYFSIRQIFNEVSAECSPDLPPLSYHRMLFYLSNIALESRKFIASPSEIAVIKEKLDLELALDQERFNGSKHCVWLGLDNDLLAEANENFTLDEMLPKIARHVEALGINNCADLFTLAQTEYPFKRLNISVFSDTLYGWRTPICNAKGVSKFCRLTHEALAMSRLFQEDPRILFDEQQYFDKAAKHNAEYEEDEEMRLVVSVDIYASIGSNLKRRSYMPEEFWGSARKENLYTAVSLDLLPLENGLKPTNRELMHKFGITIAESPSSQPRWMERLRLPAQMPGLQ